MDFPAVNNLALTLRVGGPLYVDFPRVYIYSLTISPRVGGPLIGLNDIDPVYTELPSRIEPLYVKFSHVNNLTLSPNVGRPSIGMKDIHEDPKASCQGCMI